MNWYKNTVGYNGKEVLVEGTFVDSVIRITANGYELYEKPVNLWSYQEVYADDIFNRYEGMIRKCEKKIPLLVDSGIICAEEDTV